MLIAFRTFSNLPLDIKKAIVKQRRPKSKLRSSDYGVPFYEASSFSLYSA